MNSLRFRGLWFLGSPIGSLGSLGCLWSRITVAFSLGGLWCFWGLFGCLVGRSDVSFGLLVDVDGRVTGVDLDLKVPFILFVFCEKEDFKAKLTIWGASGAEGAFDLGALGAEYPLALGALGALGAAYPLALGALGAFGAPYWPLGFLGYRERKNGQIGTFKSIFIYIKRTCPYPLEGFLGNLMLGSLGAP